MSHFTSVPSNGNGVEGHCRFGAHLAVPLGTPPGGLRGAPADLPFNTPFDTTADAPHGAARSTRRAWCLGAGRAALALMVAAQWPRQAQANDGLEARRFDTQAGMTGKPAHVPSDILSFAAGLFHSSDCDQYQYGKGRYTRTVEPDGAIRFEAETESPTYGRNVWKGVVRGRSIEGEFIFHRKPTWWRPSPDPLPHWFKGHEIDAGGKPLG